MTDPALARPRADNEEALGLYRGLGFQPVEGLATLSLFLA